jgi:hypothetical protein
LTDRRVLALSLALGLLPAPALAQERYACTTESFSTLDDDPGFVAANLRKTHAVEVLPDRVTVTTSAPDIPDHTRIYLVREEDLLHSIAEVEDRPDDRLFFPTNRAHLLTQEGWFPVTITLQSYHFANSWLLSCHPA